MGAPTGTTEQRTTTRRRWRFVGPGIVAAATGVGAGDLVATLVAGSRFGYTLLWAAVIGCVVKIALAEATGRWHLVSGRTIFAGWRSLGRWTTVYFAVYVVVWGLLYGATGTTKLTEIASILGYANHTPVSKRLARIRKQAEAFFDQMD